MSTLQAFNAEEKGRAHFHLASRVVYMMGRKFEEDDWASVYCAAKQIPKRGWSNLSLDVMHGSLGVEHKMLRAPAEKPLLEFCGTRQMHPAATRSIRIGSVDGDANETMTDVLTQYGQFIDERRKKLEEGGKAPADLRTGWLLWKTSLKEFLYFEEPTQKPNPADYFAEWKESGGGTRKKSKNLWVYEKKTGHKRFSITTQAGAKIQPYFDVPPPTDPNLYTFKVQGEEMDQGMVRMWIMSATWRELKAVVGELTPENLSVVISTAASESQANEGTVVANPESVEQLLLTAESYEVLVAAFPGAVSDQHLAQLLLERLRH